MSKLVSTNPVAPKIQERVGDWDSVVATDLELIDCAVRDKDFSGARRLEAEGCRFTAVQFARCGQEQSADWCGSREALFEDCVLENVQFDEAGFRFATFKRVRFVSCVLRNADFSGARLSGVSIGSCDFGGANFDNVTCKSVDLRGENLTALSKRVWPKGRNHLQ